MYKVFKSVGVAAVITLTASAALANGRYHPGSEPCCQPNWSGLYLGAGVGYSTFINDHTSFEFGAPSTPVSAPQDTGGQGWLGTVIVGYDHQIGTRLVIGAFVDFDWTGAEGNWRDRAAGANVAGEYAQESAWAVGGRIGWLSSPTTLLYVTGGYTEAKFDQVNLVDFAGINSDRIIRGTSFDGWFIGAGLETQLINNLSLRLEYRYSDFGEDRLTVFRESDGAAQFFKDVDLSTQSIRAVLSYKFNWDRHEPAAPLK